ncbi:MAG: PIN domain-containing protein [Chthoniobacter sp.]|uniref:type II toxin-antitoxin system VapC family toxin n=1 Tax=Chthoniobacter sp. TaxID=2510640 RepID=UPI0032A1DF09
MFEGSKRALEKCEAESHEMLISWHTLSNLFYILRRDRGAEKTVEFLRHLLSISHVAPVGHADALRAVASGLKDFEDALQLSAAESCRADAILTRNKADFGNSSNIAVLTPEEFAPPVSAGAQP